MTAPAGFRLSGPALDEGQRKVLASALADAIMHRSEHADGFCAACEVHPAALCDQGAADLDLAGAYVALGRELAIEVSR